MTDPLPIDSPDSIDLGYVAASRSGHWGAKVPSYQGRYGIFSPRQTALRFDVLLEPGERTTSVDVRFTGDFVTSFSPSAYGLGEDRVQALRNLALARIGDWVDAGEERSASEDRISLKAFSEWTRALPERTPIDEYEIVQFMASKSYWAWKFGEWKVSFQTADYLRIGRGMEEFIRIGQTHPDLWEQAHTAVPLFQSTPELIQRCERGAFPGPPRSPVAQASFSLREKKYVSPRKHIQNAADLYEEGGDRLSNAFGEAAKAVEAMLRIVCGEPDGRFKGLVSQSVSKGELHGALGQSLKSFWGFASQRPGPRHASSDPPDVTEAEAGLAINLAASWLIFLRAIDLDS